ncbi:hypothetical protein MB27_04830 [Actinoplanes utahensis]|uniref:Uncharacterized protein n=1 Tax=Actinoplanes utahensis TaxID=1869 RepID=A0A0A6UQW8_ACTUT|nr:hypothetical protein MB27_04830 [Actinoplanes utahensis]
MPPATGVALAAAFDGRTNQPTAAVASTPAVPRTASSRVCLFRMDRFPSIPLDYMWERFHRNRR